MKKFTFVAGIALSISTSAFAANFDFVNLNKNCKAFLPIIQGATIEFTGLCAKGLAEKKGLLTAKISGKKFFKKLEFWFDLYFVYFLYNGNKTHKYYEYMNKKWGKNE